MIAKNVFAYARETSANLLLKACSIEPDLFKAVVVNDPSFVLPPLLIEDSHGFLLN